MSSIYDQTYQKSIMLLKQKRKQQKISQKQLAEQLKKPQSFISKYESGERRLDFIEFISIAKLLHIDLSELIKNL